MWQFQWYNQYYGKWSVLEPWEEVQEHEEMGLAWMKYVSEDVWDHWLIVSEPIVKEK
jgi:hypothetical protein